MHLENPLHMQKAAEAPLHANRTMTQYVKACLCMLMARRVAWQSNREARLDLQGTNMLQHCIESRRRKNRKRIEVKAVLFHLFSVGFCWFPLVPIRFRLFFCCCGRSSVWSSRCDFRWIPLNSVGFRWFPLVSVGFRWIPLVSVGFRLIPLVSVRWNPLDSVGFRGALPLDSVGCLNETLLDAAAMQCKDTSKHHIILRYLESTSLAC